MKMRFTAFIIMISLLKGEVPGAIVDAVLLQQVEDTYGQCIRIVDIAGELDDDLYENRRRAEDVAFNATSKLRLCAAMVKEAQIFNRSYFTLTRGVLSVLQSSERSYLNYLLRQVGKKMGMSLYAALFDGDYYKKFHSLCDGQGPTVVVVETTTGVIFGGYTDISWSNKGGSKRSTASFLFQIRPSMIKFSVVSFEHAVVHVSGYGPTFGGGHDLHISSGATSSFNSYTDKHSYEMASRYQLNNGNKNFQVKDYVVLKAVPLY